MIFISLPNQVAVSGNSTSMLTSYATEEICRQDKMQVIFEKGKRKNADGILTN